ncbi:hypothetical protein [Oceanobacillus jordanicus]|uniref:Histidine kinase n=1 Tax=Oceanobacillus jordanicus TaxID=2867266 RepID=A0AAW5B518_9BACI|nr:hypothetical protein [Oceanobacillus jordanicus]MCG3418451.1 hypothetical protein [Oceanobacillus jordanicus]
MNLYRAKYLLYLLALIGMLLLVVLPLLSITVENPFLSKTIVVLPFVLVLMGKSLSIIDKKRNREMGLKDWTFTIGLTISMVLFLIF